MSEAMSRRAYRRRSLCLAAALIGLCAAAVRSQAGPCRGEPPLTLPPGFCVSTFAEGVGPARHLTVNERGDVFVILRLALPAHAPGGIVALRDTDGDGRADVQRRFGDVYGSDIEWRRPFLFASSTEALLRFRFRDGELLPVGLPETAIAGFPEFDDPEHSAKPFAFDPQGNVYVHVGPPSNSCQEVNRRPQSPGRKPCGLLDRAGGIWRFDSSRLGQTQADGVRVATGVRHTLAMAWNVAARSLQFVQNGRDDLARLWPAIFTAKQSAELPSEELLAVEGTADFGWPYCYHDPARGRRLLAPEYGGDGRAIGDCDQYEGPLMGFPAHWSPGDLLFYSGEQFPPRYREGAFVAFQGGWGRQPFPQQGYRVVFVPYVNGRPTGQWLPFADGFAGKETVSFPRDADYRPIGLAQGPAGELFIADGRKGRIWRVSYQAGAATPPS